MGGGNDETHGSTVSLFGQSRLLVPAHVPSHTRQARYHHVDNTLSLSILHITWKDILKNRLFLCKYSSQLYKILLKKNLFFFYCNIIFKRLKEKSRIKALASNDRKS